MKDYYKLLSIDRNLSEEEVYKRIQKIVNNVKTKKKDGSIKDKLVGDVVLLICENFTKTLEHYGSKEKYDRALEISYEKKVKVNKKFNFNGEFALKATKLCALAGVVFVTISVPFTLTTVEVPVYDGETLEDFCQSYGVPIYSVVGEKTDEQKIEFLEDGSVKVITTRSKAHDIREKSQRIAAEHDEKDDIIQAYSFNYIVKPGDTATGIFERFSLVNMPKSDLWQGEKLVLYTAEPEIAEQMNLQYEIDTAKPEPTEFEYYEVQPGDNLGTISQKFGITPQVLVQFNNISDPQSIYAGQKLIVVYEYVTGADAIDIRQQNQDANKSLS